MRGERNLDFSFIIPVYNRPDELRELLDSFTTQPSGQYEIIVIDDGSLQTCENVVNDYVEQLEIRYFFQENTGPGPARNTGANMARGHWLIFLDSDILLPGDYLNEIYDFLKRRNTDLHAFGGPDKAHASFSSTQKAISYAMTSFFTTGGIRGSSKSLEKFKPRSFNMGIRREAFSELKGFRDLRFGEDVDMSLRIEEKGYNTALIQNAYVYHKRRSNLRQFFKQVFNSGMARIVLNELHPGSLKVVHALPFLFVLFHMILLLSFGFLPAVIPATALLIYPVAVFIHSLVSSAEFTVAATAIPAAYTQLFGYGLGFSKAFLHRYILGRSVEYAFRNTFYD